jgi:hypothetical protein
MTNRAHRTRTTQPMLALFAAATATVAVLLATRPAFTDSRLGPGPASWSGDDLAIAVTWWGAVLASAWLAITTLACVAALARGRTRTAHRIARFAPPLARRVLQAALVSTWALVPAAAYAAPPSAPITVHVDARGHLTTDAPRAGTDDTPIVRTPVTRPSTTSTTRAAFTHNTTTTTSTTTPASLPRRSPPAVAPKAVTPMERPRAATPSRPPVEGPARKHAHVVVAGDNLWQIARAEVIRAGGSARPADAQIAPYWQRVVEANRSTLRSGDPSLIFAGEVVTLP